jgi:SAM-dependent methyltransferase
VGYVFSLEDARRYNDWFQTEPGRSAAVIEKDLIFRLWAPPSPQRVLEVGCGTGIFMEWLAQKGHQVTGIDPSPAMLDLARRRLPHRVSLDRGFAEDLPYEDNAFDSVFLITTLEFVNDPQKALREAFRVARRHVLLGVLNKFSLGTISHYLQGLWKPTVYRHAHYFSVFDLKNMADRALSGRVPLRWRTCLSMPLSTLPYLRFLEQSPVFQWHPFGHFIAMRIDLFYPFRTIQEPLFSEMPSGMAHAPFRTSCWRLSERKMCYNRMFWENGRQDAEKTHQTQTSLGRPPELSATPM